MVLFTKKIHTLLRQGNRDLRQSLANKGEIIFDSYPPNWTDDLKDSIRKRDNYVCQICGIHQDELEQTLHCHHIDYNKSNLNPNNLIILCPVCHLKTNGNREYWKEYFQEFEQ